MGHRTNACGRLMFPNQMSIVLYLTPMLYTFSALKISNDTSAAKSVRKQRKLSYQQSLKKLQDIEARLNNLKHLQSKQRRKLPRTDQQV